MAVATQGSTQAPPSTEGRKSLARFARWAIFAGFLFAEYLAVSLSFAAYSVLQSRGPAWDWADQIGIVGHVVVLGITSLLVLNPPAADDGGERPASPPAVKGRLLAFHAGAFASFFAVAAILFADTEPPPGPPLAWFALWGVLGGASTALLWGALFGKPRVSPHLAASALGVGVVLSVLARSVGFWSQNLWQPFSEATLICVAVLLDALFSDVYADPSELLVTLGDFAVVVEPACSGLEGVGLIVVLLSAYLFAFRRELRFPRAWLLLPLGAVAVWFGNVVRLVALIALGAYVDPNLAEKAFHSRAGWVLFCAVALGIAALGHRTALFSSARVDEAAEHDNPTAAYLLPLIALLATALVTQAFTNSYDGWYGLRIVAAAVFLVAYRRYYAELWGRVSLTAVAAGAIVAAGWLAFQPSGPAPPAAAAIAAEAGAAWLAVRVIGSALVVPICEELAFRGYLMRVVVQRDFSAVPFEAWTPLALAASAVAFGVLHERWLAGTLAGLVYGVVQIRTGRLSDAIVAHGVTNAAIAVYTLATGDFSNWA